MREGQVREIGDKEYVVNVAGYIAMVSKVPGAVWRFAFCSPDDTFDRGRGREIIRNRGYILCASDNPHHALISAVLDDVPHVPHAVRKYVMAKLDGIEWDRGQDRELFDYLRSALKQRIYGS